MKYKRPDTTERNRQREAANMAKVYEADQNEETAKMASRVAAVVIGLSPPTVLKARRAIKKGWKPNV